MAVRNSVGARRAQPAANEAAETLTTQQLLRSPLRNRMREHIVQHGPFCDGQLYKIMRRVLRSADMPEPTIRGAREALCRYGLIRLAGKGLTKEWPKSLFWEATPTGCEEFEQLNYYRQHRTLLGSRIGITSATLSSENLAIRALSNRIRSRAQDEDAVKAPARTPAPVQAAS